MIVLKVKRNHNRYAFLLQTITSSSLYCTPTYRKSNCHKSPLEGKSVEYFTQFLIKRDEGGIGVEYEASWVTQRPLFVNVGYEEREDEGLRRACALVVGGALQD